MMKRAHFDTYWDSGWPEIRWLEPYFLGQPAKRWPFSGGNDSAGLDAQGVDGTEHLEPNKGRIDIRLDMWGYPTLGMLLIYSKRGVVTGTCSVPRVT
jgi:hypothetical protein